MSPSNDLIHKDELKVGKGRQSVGRGVYPRRTVVKGYSLNVCLGRESQTTTLLGSSVGDRSSQERVEVRGLVEDIRREGSYVLSPTYESDPSSVQT